MTGGGTRSLNCVPVFPLTLTAVMWLNMATRSVCSSLCVSAGSSTLPRLTRPVQTFTPVTLPCQFRSDIPRFSAANRRMGHGRKFYHLFANILIHFSPIDSPPDAIKSKQSNKNKVRHRTEQEGPEVVKPYSFFSLGSRWGTVVKATPRPP